MSPDARLQAKRFAEQQLQIARTNVDMSIVPDEIVEETRDTLEKAWLAGYAACVNDIGTLGWLEPHRTKITPMIGGGSWWARCTCGWRTHETEGETREEVMVLAADHVADNVRRAVP